MKGGSNHKKKIVNLILHNYRMESSKEQKYTILVTS